MDKSYFYIFTCLAIGIWVICDGKRRGMSSILFGIGAFVLPFVVLPFYFASRPLIGDEIREGGYGWNVIRHFAIVWTIFMLFVGIGGFFNASHEIANVKNGAERTGAAMGTVLGIGLMGAIWFFPVAGGLVFGLILKRSGHVERASSSK